jgi:acyl-CoA-binding protein
MTNKDLDIRFQEAIETASKMSQADLPQDTQLRLYAYYKQGSVGTPALDYNANYDLRNAFKTNAWMQISNMPADEAKQLYIDLVASLQ